MSIVDAEQEDGVRIAKYSFEMDKQTSSGKKRKRNNMSPVPNKKAVSHTIASLHLLIYALLQTSARRLYVHRLRNQFLPMSSSQISQSPPQMLLPPPFAGCQWDKDNWSCAYDTAIMAYYSIYRTSTSYWRSAWSSETSLGALLAHAFDYILDKSDREHNSQYFNTIREPYRDALTERDSSAFPRHGQVGADISEVMVKTSRNILTCSVICKVCGHQERHRHLLASARPSLSSAHCIKNIIPNTSHQCAQCENTSQHSIRFETPATFTFVCEGNAQGAINPSPLIRLPNAGQYALYRLKSILYFGSYHFSARFKIELTEFQPNIVYRYDGRVCNGFAQPEIIHRQEDLLALNAAKACVYLYSVCKPLPCLCLFV